MVSITHGQEMNELKKVNPYSITFSVSNLNETADWYAKKLGFQKVAEKDYPEFKTSLVFLELNGYRVELIKDGNATSGKIKRDVPPAHTSKLGQSQFCLLTTNLNGIKSELQNNGVNIEWEFENAELGVKFLFIRDPEGNLIQYLQKI
jgi:catechol 2,3-dioxygenase-like lactoylglutathione lyase family enzyme